MNRKTLDLLSVLATFFAILVYVFVSIQMYIFLGSSEFYSNFYKILQAIGVLCFGYVSDRFCRRKTGLSTQFVALSASIGLLFFPKSILLILISGFFYNPLSILRASLLDNIPRMSKVQLIAWTFIIQILPFCFYNTLSLIHPLLLLKSATFLLSLSFVFSLFFFQDRRDRLSHNVLHFDIRQLVHPNVHKKFLFTLLAYVPAQCVNFFTGNLLGNFSSNSVLFSILSASGLVGASIAILYKKTPHVSLLTVLYGISVITATIPIVCIYFYNYQEVPIPIELIVFSTLSSFSLPFVYDIVLSSVNAYYRGFTCGILEALYSLTTLINFAFIYAFRTHILWSLSIILLLFLTATLTQRSAE